jgi:predicted SAM-dependent methyltransferase
MPADDAGVALVVSPEAIIRIRQGAFVVQMPSASARLVTLDADRMGVLACFASPTTVESAIASTGIAAGSAKRTIDDLIAAGVLRAVTGSACPSELGADHTDQSRAQAALRLLDIVVHAVAQDVSVLGTSAQARAAAATEMSVVERLEAALVGLDALRGECALWRREFVDVQLRRLGVDANTHGLRMVLLSHVLEHLSYPDDVLRLLRDVRRVLEPGGVVRIVVPDIEKCIRAYVEADSQFFEQRRDTWTWWPERGTTLEEVLPYAGAARQHGDFFGHKFGYDEETLDAVLRRAGFTTIRRCEYMQSPTLELRVDDRSLVAAARSPRGFYSLFMEATS